MYPTNLIDRAIGHVQILLRRLCRSYRKGHINKLNCQTTGDALIRTGFLKLEADLKQYYIEHGLDPNGDHTELNETLTAFLEGWRHVVNDF